MKELFQKLSNVFNFFKEKRLVQGNPEATEAEEAGTEAAEAEAEAPKDTEAPVQESEDIGAQAVAAAEAGMAQMVQTPEGGFEGPDTKITPEQAFIAHAKAAGIDTDAEPTIELGDITGGKVEGEAVAQADEPEEGMVALGEPVISETTTAQAEEPEASPPVAKVEEEE